MAKIIDVSLINVPETIIIGDNHSDLTAVAKIEFHDLDVKLNMEYILYFFIYDVHGKLDVPVMVKNWDESMLFAMNVEDSSDDFLGLNKQLIVVKEKSVEIKTDITLKLGVLDRQKTHYTKKLEAFAVLVPAIGIASKWSKAYSANIDF